MNFSRSHAPRGNGRSGLNDAERRETRVPTRSVVTRGTLFQGNGRKSLEGLVGGVNHDADRLERSDS
jgi:hypothetical protein